MTDRVQAGLLLLLLTVLGVVGYNIWLLESGGEKWIYSDFLSRLKEGTVVSVTLTGLQLTGEDSSGHTFQTVAPDIAALLPQLIAAQVVIDTRMPQGFVDRLPHLLLFMLAVSGVWMLLTGRSRKRAPLWRGTGAARSRKGSSAVRFADVAGIDEVRDEVREIVDFLQNHESYNQLGGRIPKGVLLQGPPGTGKTLLARAIAGEAGVPFFSLGGSDFVEMFAGVGASRVRELFRSAKHNAPSIIFIDEIDAIGTKRNSSSSHEEREQTLNALLVEMDGFASSETVIVIGATNRPETLDPALLRPGRFDRQLIVGLPSIQGRVKILEVHTRRVAISEAINLLSIAQSIPGFSGADIANLVNEAALLAARHQKSRVEMGDFEEARDKILLGVERRNAAVNEQERRIIAYHEAGHAIVARMLPECDSIEKITIIPRGFALGLTQQIQLEERYTYSLDYLLSRIQVLLGGRIAEKIVFNKLSTGAANDIATATDIAVRIVCEWGMSSVLGSTVWCGRRHGLDGPVASGLRSGHSEATGREVDLEIRRIIEDCGLQTEKLLRSHNRLLHDLAEVLLANETIDAEEMEIVVQCAASSRGRIRRVRPAQNGRDGDGTGKTDRGG